MTIHEIEMTIGKVEDLGGMTVNERLYFTGLMDEYDNALKYDHHKAKTILSLLGVDQSSIEKIVV